MRFNSATAMPRRSSWVWPLVQALLLAGAVRGTLHIIRLVILATLGLGGLVLYQAISSGKPISHIQSSIGKRSVPAGDSPPLLPSPGVSGALQGALRSALEGQQPSLGLALELDDRECARLYLCEQAALRRSTLDLVPPHSSARTAEDLTALAEFQRSAELGSSIGDPTVCRTHYTKCPYRSVAQIQDIMQRFKYI